MRIAFVTTEFVTEPLFDGGLANYLLRVALSLKSFGHTPVIFVTTDRDGEIIYRGIQIYRVRAVLKNLPRLIDTHITSKINRTFWYLSSSYLVNARLKEVHQKAPFDIVQYTHLIGLGLFRLRNIPSVVRLSSATQVCMDASEIKGPRQQYIWENMAIRRMDGVFGPSKLVSSITQTSLGKPVKIIESPFIFDNEEDDFTTYNQYLADKKYLLFFGTIGLLKGVGTISKILKPLLAKYPDLYFVFVGKDQGMPDGSPVIKKVISQADGYHDRVLFLGRLKHDALYPIIAKALAVVLPSRVDNFPNTCIEAMAHQKVVIGTWGTSMEQLIEDGKSGFLSEIDNSLNLFETIEKAINLPSQEREKMGKLALERIQKLRPEVVVKQLLDYYQEVIEEKAVRENH